MDTDGGLCNTHPYIGNECLLWKWDSGRESEKVGPLVDLLSKGNRDLFVCVQLKGFLLRQNIFLLQWTCLTHELHQEIPSPTPHLHTYIDTQYAPYVCMVPLWLLNDFMLLHTTTCMYIGSCLCIVIQSHHHPASGHEHLHGCTPSNTSLRNARLPLVMPLFL